MEVDTYYPSWFRLTFGGGFFFRGRDPKMISCNPPVIKLNKLVTDTTAVSKNDRCKHKSPHFLNRKSCKEIVHWL